MVLLFVQLVEGLRMRREGRFLLSLSLSVISVTCAFRGPKPFESVTRPPRETRATRRGEGKSGGVGLRLSSSLREGRFGFCVLFAATFLHGNRLLLEPP